VVSALGGYPVPFTVLAGTSAAPWPQPAPPRWFCASCQGTSAGAPAGPASATSKGAADDRRAGEPGR